MKFHYYGMIMAATIGMSAVSGATFAEEVVATVNGKPISQRVYEIYLKKLQSQQPQLAGNRELIIQDLVNRELLYQDALKKGLEKDKDVVFALDQIRKNTLIQANVGKFTQDHPITDADLKKEYDENIAKLDMNEYKARHVLLKTEDEAKAVIKELDNGAVFVDVANAKTIEPNSNGGDLGWFKPQQMVTEFSEAVAKLKKGEYTKTPVKSQFGWHVILLEDTRKATPPKFEDVKQQLRAMMRNQQLQDYITNLRKTAKIDIKK